MYDRLWLLLRRRVNVLKCKGFGICFIIGVDQFFMILSSFYWSKIWLFGFK